MTWLLILLILVVVLGWHFVFALLGGVLIIGAAGIFIAIASIVLFCVAVLTSLSFSGAVGLIAGGIFCNVDYYCNNLSTYTFSNRITFIHHFCSSYYKTKKAPSYKKFI